MRNLNIGMVIAEIILGAVCIGLGIYYIFTGDAAQIAVFIIVGAICVIMGIRTLILYLKQQKKDDEDKDKK